MIFFLNAINLVTVLASFVVQILIVRFFGASDATDIYYSIIIMTTFITGLSTGFLTDLFIPIYHDAKKRDVRDAQRLTGGVLTLSILSGSILTIIVYAFAPEIVSIFASGFHATKFTDAVRMLRIASLSIVFTSMTTILNSTLNANSFLLITYVTNLILPTFNLIAVITLASRYGVASLMYAILFASMLTFLIVFSYCKNKVGARFANPLGQKDISYLLKKNIPVRGSHIVNMLRGPLTTTVLSYFPSGNLTLYSYADKIASVLVGTTNSPLAQVYYIRSSELASKKAFYEIRELLLDILRSSVVLFAGGFFLIVIVFQKAFGVIFAGKVPPDGIHMMFLLLLSLYPFYYSTLIGTELGATGLAMKKGRLNFYAAALFVAILAVSVVPLVKSLSLYGLPISLFLAQVSSLVLYAALVNKIENLIRFEIISAQLNTLIVSVLVLLIGFFMAGNTVLQLAAESTLFLVWILTNWNSALHAMKMITAKGEVK